jgi:hypothetical protein
LAGFTFFVLVVSDTAVGGAAKMVAAENSMATAISITFFMEIKINKWIISIRHNKPNTLIIKLR